ncbi:hypothetical protein SH661x_001486 [Planctomicrobium sp. SH661]|uniref:hypothetical protein n=1 Tax=Planctomicrobium sp. SH661 TaxID=3448124 RepID=UPI003F5CB265
MMTRFRTWMFDNLQPLLTGCALLGMLCSGCAIRGNSELLEAQLRHQETVIRKFERETSQLRDELALSQKEIDLLRADQAAQGSLLTAEETTRSLAKAKGIVFNTLLTAGQNHDDAPGDERFHAVFYPHDAQGEIVKLSGRLEFEAIDLARPDSQKSIGRWEYTPEEARKLWHAGFLTSGFQMEEAWKTPPIGSKVLLFAKLTTLDGRQFEATHVIPIEPHPGGSAPPQSMPQPASANPLETVSFEAPSETRRVPEPERWEFQTTPSSKPQRPAGDLPAKEKATAELPARKPATVELPDSTPPPVDARPFPDGTRTSDNWTEETIPTLR